MNDVALTIQRRPDGVGLLVFDSPGSPINIISRRLFEQFDACLDEIERDASIRAVVLTSAKPDSFIAGADVKEFFTFTEPSQGESFSRVGHALLDRISYSRKPFVAAIHGSAFGGGLEVALACHYRVASDDPKTVLALPEVTLGIIPGGGGTQRLPAIIGLSQALPMMLTGSRIRSGKASRLGLVDAVLPAHGMVDTCARIALGLADGTVERRLPKKDLLRSLLDSSLARSFVMGKARKSVMKTTRGLYPAPLAILDCVEAGPGNETVGYERESVHFGRMATTPECKSLIGLFLATTELKKRKAASEPVRVKSIAVIGGGFMGAGIASVSLEKYGVALGDLSHDSLGKAAATIDKGLDKRVKSGSLRRIDADRQRSALRLTTRLEDCAAADIFIEAVFEDLALKQKVLAQVEDIARPDAVFASNTSALPIGEIADMAKHPERVLGMHYFSPVHRMPLLEIVRANATADWAVETARAVGIAQGKTVIVVRDGPGFYTTRILAPYLNEAVKLVSEGADVHALDEAIRNFGFPVGPISLIDEVGIDVGAHVSSHLGRVFAERGLSPSLQMEQMAAAGFAGRKNGRGFYRYDGKKGSSKEANPEAYAFFGGPHRAGVNPTEAVERLFLSMVNEAAYCLQEEVVEGPLDADVGAVLGLGFPPSRGGPFRFVDAVGAGNVVDRLRRLSHAHGTRFEPAPILVDTASGGRRFYEN